MKRSLKFFHWLSIFTLFIFITGCGTSSSQNTTGNEGNESTNQEKNFMEDVDKNPIVTIVMDNAEEIKIELFPKIAPNTVTNFISLINQEYYDGVIFHRVIPGFMIQGGDPDGTGMGGPDYSIAGEFSSNGFPNSLLHEEGIISMARTNDPNSAGSQFFIMVDAAPHLDGDYAAFGKVIEGMDIVHSIVSTKRDSQDKPLEDQKMKKVMVETFGYDYKEPKKIQ